MAGFVIRREDAPDFSQVYEVERLAFGGPLQADLVEDLRGSASPQLSLVAEQEGEVVGHIFFSPVTFAREKAPPAAQLSPVAVAPACQGRGIGAALVREGLVECPDLGWSSVFLVGNPVYYARFGFQMAGPLGFSCGGPHDAFLQVLELQPKALAGASGPVAFHAAFSRLESR